ncbi:MAG: hypothetical protein WCI95_07665 [bacterium]
MSRLKIYLPIYLAQPLLTFHYSIHAINATTTASYSKKCGQLRPFRRGHAFRFTVAQPTTWRGSGDLSVAIDGFEEQCLDFSVEALSPALVFESERLLKEYGKTNGLRTLDALHLAGFSVIAEPDWSFVTADTNQADVCRLMGWRVVNPLLAP